jgi:hypothetical protein
MFISWMLQAIVLVFLAAIGFCHGQRYVLSYSILSSFVVVQHVLDEHSNYFWWSMVGSRCYVLERSISASSSLLNLSILLSRWQLLLSLMHRKKSAGCCCAPPLHPHAKAAYKAPSRLPSSSITILNHTKTPLRLKRIHVIWNGSQYIYFTLNEYLP